VALQNYKIKFKNGATQMVTSGAPAASGTWLVFGDGSGEVLRVPAADVESVSRDGVAEREEPPVRSNVRANN
jgi:hypothetical protein